MGFISLNVVWDAYQKATDFAREIRTHVNMGVARAASGIEAQTNKILKEYYGHDSDSIGRVDKKEVVTLIDKTWRGLCWAKWATIGITITSYFISRHTPIFAPLFRISSVVSLIAANEFYQIQNVVWDAKKIIVQDIPEDKVIWLGKDSRAMNQISPVIERISMLLQNRLIFVNRSFLFGQEIRLLHDYMTRKIQAAFDKKQDTPHTQIMWVPDRSKDQETMRCYIDRLKDKVVALIKDFDRNTSHGVSAIRVQMLVQEGLRPFAFARAVAITAAIAFYTASVYLPLGWLTFAATLGTGFLALEVHQLHESVRTEICEPLIAREKYDITYIETMRLIKSASLRMRDTTWLLHKNFFFGREIQKTPEYFDQLYMVGGDLKDETVRWVEKSTITAILTMMKNWKIYIPAWAK